VGSIPASLKVPEHLKTRMLNGIAGFYLPHKISGGTPNTPQRILMF
jgi:hypothetical protein